MKASLNLRARIGTTTLDVTTTETHVEVDGLRRPYRFEAVGAGTYLMQIDGQVHRVHVEPLDEGRVQVTIAGRRSVVHVQDEQDLLLERFGWQDDGAGGEREIRAPMPGLVLAVRVEAGRPVEAGDGLLVLEAMKMENELRATAPGVVEAVHVAPGDAVSKNHLLLTMRSGT